MRFRVVKRVKGELNLSLVYLVVTLVLAGLAYGLFRLHAIPAIPCPFKEMTGYPCPTCGSTRLVLSLFHVNLKQAFLWNPGLFLFGMAAVFWFAYGIVSQLSGKKVSILLSKQEGIWFRILLLFLFVLNWVYLIIAGV